MEDVNGSGGGEIVGLEERETFEGERKASDGRLYPHTGLISI